MEIYTCRTPKRPKSPVSLPKNVGQACLEVVAGRPCFKFVILSTYFAAVVVAVAGPSLAVALAASLAVPSIAVAVAVAASLAALPLAMAVAVAASLATTFSVASSLAIAKPLVSCRLSQRAPFFASATIVYLHT